MKILKQENWWIWLLLLLFGGGGHNLILGALLDVYDKDAWYAQAKNWFIGLICFIFPFFIMMTVFVIQITCLTAAKLEVPGKEIYLSPYIWLLMIIIPVIGWIFLSLMIIYLSIWTIVMLYRGAGEKYAK
ncbi:MAG: hypothetical protein WDA12_01320 [Bacilli bacterium]